MIRGLVFDFDGLILETETPILQAWSEVYAEHGQTIPMERWHEILGTASSVHGGFDPLEHLAALVGDGLDREAIASRRAARRTELIEALDVMDGVREVIADALRLDLRLSVASSSSRSWVLGHLERLGLHEHWDAVRCREDVEHAKPAPDLYLAAVDAMGVSPHQAVAFEDAPNGIAAAKAAGLLCVAVPNALTRDLDLSRADLRLASLADEPLERILARLGAAR